MAQQTYIYDTHIRWAGKRRGNLRAEGVPDLTVSTPPEFKGEAGFWTPEHLFVAAAEACLMATFIGIAENSHLSFSSYRSAAQGKLEPVEGSGLRFTEIKIFPVVELERAEDRERADRIMAKAAKNCLVANSILARVAIEPAFTFNDVPSAAA
jgi:organic hydroperoxide reductase OsmC/OhrA